MSDEEKRRCGRLENAGRAIALGALAAMPLCGLILFFEATQPARLTDNAVVFTKLYDPRAARSEGHPQAVTHFRGVSAEVQQASTHLTSKVFSASEAQEVFADDSFKALKTGFQTEFVSKNRHRIAIRIVGREPIVDQEMPDNSRMMEISPASTAKMVSFVWGQWLYSAEVEDKGAEPTIVVQKVL